MFVGHKKNWDQLSNEVREDKLPPAYLFYGLSGIGKQMVAKSFVQWLFCEGDLVITRPLTPSPQGRGNFSDVATGGDDRRPCLNCSACQRIVSHQHPDFFFVKPPPGKTIKIDELRALQGALHKAPLEAPLKVVLINDAQEMTLQAANSLLKILEEPPDKTLFILIAPTLFGLLPTIRSRCRHIHFAAPSTEEILPHLVKEWGMERSVVTELLKAADGSPGMAQKMNEAGFSEILNEVSTLMVEGKKSFSLLSESARKWTESEIDLELLLEAAKKRIGLSHVEKIDRMTQAQKDLRAHVNKTLVLENLLMDL